MNKRVLGLLLALVMVLTMLPFGAAAAEEKTYPATRIGMYEAVYELFGEPCPDTQLPYTDLEGLNEHQLAAIRWACHEAFYTFAAAGDRFGANERASNYAIFTFIYLAAGMPDVTQPDTGYVAPAELWNNEYHIIDVVGDTGGKPLPECYADSIVVQPGEDIYHSKVTISMEHSWDEGVVTKAPTCGSTGELTYTCTGCGMTRTETLPVAHTEWDESTLDESTPATGTEPGYALYHCKNCEQETILVRTPALGDDALAQEFTDVAADQFYAEPVDWAVRRGVTNGTGKGIFTPDGTCTRAQVVTFLWRAYGCPEPETDTMPFVDVEKDAYYADAVLWAVENGITNGTDKEHFSPENPCTRAHVVTFLWRAEYEGQGAYFGTFEDVDSPSEYYFTAVYWANLHGITNGTDATHFSPHAPCTRGQIVTFIYRAFSEPVTFIFYEG